ncbi:MAG: uroporphyrinogen-III C-methyltransferase [Chloroflexi bacterium]|nr:uroporphyrinogen-III C-methyltransferase [Chloroflexota bacterium]
MADSGGRPVTRGFVYIVGAGPGDTELITVRGARCLEQADVVVYDRLVNAALLNLARPETERIGVGKAAEKPSMRQEAINQLLVDRARAGRVVVRLKGGDPFVFGRGGEEARALADAGVPFEVVPGVTAAVAVPAVAGIPVTHRGVSRSFAVVTGHTHDGGLPDLPVADTLVVLMSVNPLKQIVAGLLAQGRPATTLAAVVSEGTTPRQRVVTGTLADIADRANGLEPPAVLVVGEVVRLREALATPPSP